MSGGVPAGEAHDPDCGLLHEDGTEHCTCKLLPCPFCGGEGFLNKPHNGRTPFVMCRSCNGCGAQCSDPITAWNTRATPTPPPSRDANVERVELVARAICTQQIPVNLHRFNRRGYVERHWHLYEDHARAALQALGERG